VAQQPKSDLGRLVFEVSGLHTIRHKHASQAGLLNEWAARHKGPYLRDTQQTQQTNIMPSVGFELAIAAIERPQIYVLERTATGIDC